MRKMRFRLDVDDAAVARSLVERRKRPCIKVNAKCWDHTLFSDWDRESIQGRKARNIQESDGAVESAVNINIGWR
jgi:hypothetical protein